MVSEDVRAQIAAELFKHLQNTEKHLVAREQCRIAVRLTDMLIQELNKESKKPIDLDVILSQKLSSFSELSIRAKHCLSYNDIYTIKDLVKYTKVDLLKMRNMGQITINHLEEFLSGFGLYLGMYL